jgi:acyl homoserine lactone synthase
MILHEPARSLTEMERVLERELAFCEDNMTVKILTSQAELNQAFRLRHEIFAEELKWVPEDEFGLEIDRYDVNGVHFGVMDMDGNLLAYMRILPTSGPYMLENEFSFLVGRDHDIRHSFDTAEISRLCVSRTARSKVVTGNFGMHSTSILLLKGVYHWSSKEHVRYLYAVTEDKVHRLYRAKGFPFKAIGDVKVMPDGVNAVAIMLDWYEFSMNNLAKKPRFYSWFSQVQPSPVPAR